MSIQRRKPRKNVTVVGIIGQGRRLCAAETGAAAVGETPGDDALQFTVMPVRIRGAFWICALAIVTLLSVPRIGGSEHLWMNGLYDTLCAVVLFPLLVCLGASGKTTDRVTTRVCKFLGDISYPLYMVHYPFIYLYYAWVKNENLTFTESLPGALALVAGSVILAYLCLKLYDEPVRRFLTDRFLRREK